jgi:hypothetical protein
MLSAVAITAQRHEIRRIIRATIAQRHTVMNLEAIRPAAHPAPATIPLDDPGAQRGPLPSVDLPRRLTRRAARAAGG